jgi:hypothetical protein
MVNSFTELLICGTPAVVTAAVAGTAWWTQPPRRALRVGGAVAGSALRRAARREIPVALVALTSVACGVLAFVTHPADVSGGRALGGAVVALMASALPLSLYWVMGRVVRRLLVLVVAWAVSLAPLYYYALFAALIVFSLSQCGPASDCFG